MRSRFSYFILIPLVICLVAWGVYDDFWIGVLIFGVGFVVTFLYEQHRMGKPPFSPRDPREL